MRREKRVELPTAAAAAFTFLITGAREGWQTNAAERRAVARV